MEKIPIRQLTTLKEPAFSENFVIRDLGHFLDGKDMDQELHRHDFFYVLVLKKGSGTHDIDFTSYMISDHTVFFMRPGQVHQIVLKAESTGYLMQFRDVFYAPHDKATGRLLRKASSTNHYQTDSDKFQKLLALLNNIFGEYTAQQEGYEEVIKASMGIFFIELVRLNDGKPMENANLYAQEKLDKFSTLLETHIFEYKQVAQYADRLHLSTYQLNAIAKSTLGKTPSELINEQILLEAKRCLLSTSAQVNQVAERMGYEDVSYFIRFFKKHTGYSPEAFRNNFR